MGPEEDLPPGEQLLILLRPFRQDLAASNPSPKTIQIPAASARDGWGQVEIQQPRVPLSPRSAYPTRSKRKELDPCLVRWSFLISELENARARCPSDDRGGHEGTSIEPLNDGTINGETGAPERRPSQPSKEAVLNVSQNLELLTQLSPVSVGNCGLGPREQISIPRGRVIQGLSRYSAQDVVRPKTILQVG
jgi:hypothetical protein